MPARKKIDVAVLSNGQKIEVHEPFLAYITRGRGTVNNEIVENGDLVRAESLIFKAIKDVKLIVVHVGE